MSKSFHEFEATINKYYLYFIVYGEDDALSAREQKIITQFLDSYKTNETDQVVVGMKNDHSDSFIDTCDISNEHSDCIELIITVFHSNK